MNGQMIQYVDTTTSIQHKNTADLILYNCGTENCAPGHAFGPIAREFNLIHFVIGGRGRLEIRQQEFGIGPGQAFLIPANEVAYYQADRTDPWEYCWVGFMGIRSQTYLRSMFPSRDQPFVLDVEDISYFQATILEMLRIGDHRLTSSLAIQGYLYHMLARLVKDSGDVREGDRRVPYSTQAMNYIEKNYNSGLQIHDVASYLGLHPNYLSAVFKQETGKTPKQYMMELRIRKASELLRQTDYPILVISKSVGYADQLTFSRAFKSMTGMSPTDYRQQFL